MIKRIFAAAFLLTLLSGCAGKPALDPESQQASSKYLQSMDTVMQLTAYGSGREAALEAGSQEILRLDELLSTGKETSEISTLNREGSGSCSDDTAVLVSRAMALHDSTDGLFDITIYPLTALWGFPTKQYHVPTQDELEDVLGRLGSDRLSFDPGSKSLVLGAGQAIDLGGIAKGYTSARVMELFRENGVTSGMVSLGGNIQCLGSKPDGSAWKIGITDPWNKESGLYAVVQVRDEAVITSGGYERYFADEATGQIYRHILDPRTGYPAESGLASVSIVTPDGTLGDGLSTALYIMGLEGAADYWRQHSDSFEGIFITEDGALYVTEGLKDRITSQHSITVISKNG